MADKLIPGPRDCLLVIDVQNDFCTGGALAVPEGEAVVPVINSLMPHFETVVLTQDHHPADHVSFAAQHVGMAPFEAVELPYGRQTLWPDHCVIGSAGAAFHPDLETDRARLILRKGLRRQVDSYSAFFENDRQTRTGLEGYLRECRVQRVILCGLATDYCVSWTAQDAVALGITVVLVEDACRAIDRNGSLAEALRQMEDAGVWRLRSDAIIHAADAEPERMHG